MNDSNSGVEKCKGIKELLSAYLDNELAVNERGPVAEHLVKCPGCRGELSQIESVVRGLKKLPVVELNKDLSGQIEARISGLGQVSMSKSGRTQPAHPTCGLSTKPWLRRMALAAAITFLALAAGYFSVSGGIFDRLPTIELAKKSPTTEGVNQGVDVQIADGEATNPDTNTPAIPAIVDADRPGKRRAIAQTTARIPHMSAQRDVEAGIKPGRPAQEEEPGVRVSVKRSNAQDMPSPAAPQKARSRERPSAEIEDFFNSEALVAVSDSYEDDIFGNLGVSTDEDGLYAIKM